MKNNVHVVMSQNVALSSNDAIANTSSHLIRCLSEADSLNFSVICGSTGQSDDGFYDSKVDIHQTDTHMLSAFDNLKYPLLSYRILKKIHSRAPIDIIHARYPLSSLISAVLFKRKISPKTRIVYDIGSPWIEMTGERFRLFSSFLLKQALYSVEKKLFQNVDGFYFQNEDVADFYMRRISNVQGKPQEYLNFELDSGIFQPRPYNSEIAQGLGCKRTDVVIGIVAGLARMRQLAFVIRGFAAFKKESDLDNLRMVVVGEGSDKQNLQRLVRQMGLSDSVIFTGKVEHNKIPEYLSVFDVGISHLPNKVVFEVSSPLKLMEYLSCGLPVLASNVIAHRRLNKYSEDIFLYDNNIESFCSSLHKLVSVLPSKDEVYSNMKSLTQLFGSATIKDNLVKLYTRILF